MRSRSTRYGLCSIPVALFATLAMPEPLGAEPVRVATELRVEPGQSGSPSLVRVRFNRTPEYTARYEREARRIVIDVADTGITEKPWVVTPSAGLIAGVLTQTYRNEGKELLRIWVTLAKDAEYRVAADGTDLVVAVDDSGSFSRALPSAAKTVAQPEPSAITDVRFEQRGLTDRLRIELSSVPRFRTERVGERLVRIALEASTLPTQLARVLDLSKAGQYLTHVASYPDPGSPARVLLEAELRPGCEQRLSVEGRALVWEFYRADSLPSSMTGVASDGGVARRTKAFSDPGPEVELQKIEGAPMLEEHRGAVEEARGVTPQLFAQQRPGNFTGRRIDLDLKDADIHNVLRLLADVGQVNVVTADNVGGTVTIRMRNVPWDQALDVILQAKSLGMVRQANMIRVAPLADLEKERDLAIARAKQEVQLAPVETRLIPVSYARATDIQQRARDLLSERGSIAVDERTNVMIVRDVAGNMNQIEELTRALDTQTPQVLVEARIIEATSRYTRDIGIQWGGDATFSAATANPTGLAFPNTVGIAGGASDGDTPTAGLSATSNTVANPNFAVNLPAAVGTGSGGAIGLTFGSIDNTINLALRLSAAEATGMVRILSSPRVLTLDNRDARIAQGTLIPFSQVSAQGVQTTFQEAKLQLLVSPHVTADGSVSMKVKINRDEPDFNQTSARGDPTILKREAETELLVMDGHTAVIGGIYTRNTGRNLDQVPFFGDIPIIGLLFQHRRASDQRGELVIFLTPRIVNRAEALGR